MTQEDLNNIFSFHPPTPEKLLQYDDIRSTCRELAGLINDSCPESTEKSLAIIKLEEVMFWANASIARN